MSYPPPSSYSQTNLQSSTNYIQVVAYHSFIYYLIPGSTFNTISKIDGAGNDSLLTTLDTMYQSIGISQDGATLYSFKANGSSLLLIDAVTGASTLYNGPLGVTGLYR
jgi:hypothetical protein